MLQGLSDHRVVYDAIPFFCRPSHVQLFQKQELLWLASGPQARRLLPSLHRCRTNPFSWWLIFNTFVKSA